VYGLGWSGGMVQKFANGMNHTSQIFSSGISFYISLDGPKIKDCYLFEGTIKQLKK
jgi:hypothetical protein